MSKKRPGVQAGVNLVEAVHATQEEWEKVESFCKVVMNDIPKLAELEDALNAFATAQRSSFSKAELDQIVLWKHTVGKNRVYNMKHINANSDESVKEYSTKAIQLAMEIDLNGLVDVNSGTVNQNGKKSVQAALEVLTKNLKGVGPATASAILTLVRPDIFCYLFDEVIDVFEPKRDYTLPIYLRVNSRCLHIAQKLNGEWTSGRVAKTIWMAARFLAERRKDPTKELNLLLVNEKKRPAAIDEKGDTKMIQPDEVDDMAKTRRSARSKRQRKS